MENVDVLVVGAGPTGLMLALELAMQNISFRIIDKDPVRSDKSRALVVHSRTLEILDRHGIARDLMARGQNGSGLRIYVDKKLVTDFDWVKKGFEDTSFPTPLFISQADTETFLEDALKRNGHVVERPLTAEKIEQDDTGVTAWLDRADGIKQQVRCKFAVGCDGAHSLVRKSANLTFEGSPYPQDFILADVHLKWEHRSDRLTAFLGHGILMGFPLKDGLFRLVASRHGGLEKHEEPTIADFEKIFAEMAPGQAELVDPVWITRFRLHHRGVNNYRAGRMFVAGDAAHIHSPAGGQGMNTGMQDAVNLGWKLALVIRGEKEDSLLDTYDVERRRVGDILLRTTDRSFQYGTSTNPLFLLLRNFIVPWIAPWIFQEGSRRFRFISQLGIRYRTSPIVGSASRYKGPLHGGDRAPDGNLKSDDGTTTLLGLCKGPTHHLILFSGTGTAAVDDSALQAAAASFLVANSKWVQLHKVLTASPLETSHYVDDEEKIHTRYGFRDPGYVLIRPDGYIAHIGPLDSIDELQSWVNR